MLKPKFTTKNDIINDKNLETIYQYTYSKKNDCITFFVDRHSNKKSVF